MESDRIARPVVRWRNRARVPYGFRFTRYLLRFALPFTPPVTRWKASSWGWLALLIGIQVGLIFYVNLSVPGNRAVDNEVRWAWYVGQIVVLFLGLIPTSSATEDERSKTLDFRGGEEEDAAIVDYEYAVTRHGRWVGFRLVAARRVHRLWGVVAIEMADRRYLCVPRALFPSKEDWREVEAWLSSSS